MARRFQNIPQATSSNTQDVLRALGDVVGYITAQTQPTITPLATTATLAEVVAKVNALLARLQGTP